MDETDDITITEEARGQLRGHLEAGGARFIRIHVGRG